jgi:hypothetical protein
VSSVKKRVLFYLGGYDPRGVRNYYNLYKKEGHKSNRVDTMQLKISSRKSFAPHLKGWEIEAEDEGERVETTYYFLEWDDLFRKGWKRSFWQLMGNILTYLRAYLFSPLIWRTILLAPHALQSLWYPLVYLLLTLFGAWGLYGVSEWLLAEYLVVWVRVPLLLVLLYFWFDFAWKLSHKVAVLWLFKALCFYAEYIKRPDRELQERLVRFASVIIEAIQEAKSQGVDEVLLVSHSAGTVLSIDLLDLVLEAFEPEDRRLRRFSIVTLGHFIPLVSLQKEATKYRQKMQRIATYPIIWIDYTSVIDGVTFYLHDYFASSGVVKKGLKFSALSPRFHRLYGKEEYKAIRKDIHLAHFLYLLAPSRRDHYNYFHLSAGKDSLEIFTQGEKR